MHLYCRNATLDSRKLPGDEPLEISVSQTAQLVERPLSRSGAHSHVSRDWPSIFSKTKVFENLTEAHRAPREINTLRFSKIVLETVFSIRTIATSFDKKDTHASVRQAST